MILRIYLRKKEVRYSNPKASSKNTRFTFSATWKAASVGSRGMAYGALEAAGWLCRTSCAAFT